MSSRIKTVVWQEGERDAILRAAARGDVTRSVSGYDLWRNPPGLRTGTDYMPRRVDRKVAQLAHEGVLALGNDGVWRPTTTSERHPT